MTEMRISLGSRHSFFNQYSCSSPPPAPAMPPFDTTITVKDLMPTSSTPPRTESGSGRTIYTKEGVSRGRLETMSGCGPGKSNPLVEVGTC